MFNPASAFARDLSVLCLAAVVRPGFAALDGLTGVGSRAVRWRSEVAGDFDVCANDRSPAALAIARQNAAGRSGLELTGRHLCALLGERGFDFVEVDAAGTPMPFLDAACQSLRAGGPQASPGDPRYLLVTATDTMVLAGAQPEVCRRWYGARPLRGELGHEVAVRILVGAIARAAARYGLGARPALAYWHDHWYGAFIRLVRDDAGADAALDQLGWAVRCGECWDRRVVPGEVAGIRCALCGGPLDRAGPLWTGGLWEAALLDRLLRDGRPLAAERAVRTALAGWRLEADAPALFYDLHAAARHLGRGADTPDLDHFRRRLTAQGHSCVRTHFAKVGVKTDAAAGQVLALLRESPRREAGEVAKEGAVP